MDATFTLDADEIKQAALEWLAKNRGIKVANSDSLDWGIGTEEGFEDNEDLNDGYRLTVRRTNFTAQQEMASYLK